MRATAQGEKINGGQQSLFDNATRVFAAECIELPFRQGAIAGWVEQTEELLIGHDGRTIEPRSIADGAHGSRTSAYRPMEPVHCRVGSVQEWSRAIKSCPGRQS